MDKDITEPIDLGDGLILRRATADDSMALMDFNSRIHSDDGPDQPDPYIAAWVRDLLEKPHPTFQPGDFTLVIDTHTGSVVSSLNLISQTWAYEGIPFGVGRPELVGTLPEYRNRGLIRAQFEVIHQWSSARREQVQAITGIPYYYRIFGYEMALNLGGGRAGYIHQVPKLKEGQDDPYRVRQARVADLPFIQELYQHGARRGPIQVVWDQALFLYELNGKASDNINRLELRMVENLAGEPVGFIAHSSRLWGSMQPVNIYEIKPGLSWGQVTPSIVRYLWSTGEANYAAKMEKKEVFNSFGLHLGETHPAYEVMHNSLPRQQKPYAWYVRVPDVPGFVQHIAPALEHRLENSSYSGHSGEYLITFYRSGLKFKLVNGQMADVTAWKPEPQGHSGNAAFPGLTFLQLLFGYRSLDDLKNAYPDCWWSSDESYGILNALFPRKASDLWAVS